MKRLPPAQITVLIRFAVEAKKLQVEAIPILRPLFCFTNFLWSTMEFGQVVSARCVIDALWAESVQASQTVVR